MNPAGNLNALLRRPDIWRGKTTPLRLDARHLSTGHEALDRLLPGGGWPRGALIELLLDGEGIGELQLLMPALARLNGEDGWLTWIDPPHTPYPPALATRGLDLSRLLFVHPSTPQQRLWALEQSLSSGDCSAVLAWLPPRLGERILRRLQLATESGGSLAFLFRPGSSRSEASPAALRLKLNPAAGALGIEIIKCRGSWSRGSIMLPSNAVA